MKKSHKSDIFPIKVAYLDYSDIYAGAERVLHMILQNIDRTKVEPVLVLPCPRQHHTGYDDLDCRRIYLSSKIRWWMGRAYWQHPLRGMDFLSRVIFGVLLAIRMMRENVKILHVNLLRRDCCMWLYPSFLLGIKIVGHFRSMTPEWIPPARVWKKCRCIACVSDFNRGILCGAIPEVAPRAATVYDAVDSGMFLYGNEKERRMPNDSILISSVGQLSPEKGHDTAIRAFERIWRNYPDSKLRIVGGGSDEYAEYLSKLATSFGDEFKRHVIIGGFQELDMRDVYRKSTITLSLSKEGEAFGLVPYESVLADTPCITPGRGAATEFINCDNGYPVDPFNIEEVAEKIHGIIDCPEESIRKINILKETVITQLSPERMMEKLYNLYQTVANE